MGMRRVHAQSASECMRRVHARMHRRRWWLWWRQRRWRRRRQKRGQRQQRWRWRQRWAGAKEEREAATVEAATAEVTVVAMAAAVVTNACTERHHTRQERAVVTVTERGDVAVAREGVSAARVREGGCTSAARAGNGAASTSREERRPCWLLAHAGGSVAVVTAASADAQPDALHGRRHKRPRQQLHLACRAAQRPRDE